MTPHVQPMIGGSQMLQPSSPGAFRMPPPGNPANRQLLASHLGQNAVVATPKPLPLDAASQLAVQHHQLVQPHPLQRPPMSMSANQLAAAQMNGQPHNPQMNTPMVGHSPHLQPFQFLQQHQQHQQQLQPHQQQQKQQHQQQPQQMMQRKLLSGAMGGMGGMNGMSGINAQTGMGNLVGLNGIPGMTTMSPMTGAMMGLSGLANMNMNSLGQNSVGNLMNQPLRPSGIATAQTLSSKNRIAPNRSRTGALGGTQPTRTQLDSLPPLVAAAQLQGSSGVPMMGQPLQRGNVAPMQRNVAAGMASPKGNPSMSGVPGQAFGMGAAPNAPQMTQNPQQLTAQQHLTAQPLNSTLNVGVLGPLVGNPASPQLSSQSLSSVSGLTTASMDLQNVNRRK